MNPFLSPWHMMGLIKTLKAIFLTELKKQRVYIHTFKIEHFNLYKLEFNVGGEEKNIVRSGIRKCVRERERELGRTKEA